MPALVDHEVRRREITSAARRVIVDRGLSAVTFQAVAAEAGMSVRLIQYYFGTKAEFLLATHRSVMDDVGARFVQTWSALGDEATPRETIRAVLVELLPLDEVRREETIVLGAFGADTRTSDGIGSEATTAAPSALVSILTGQLGRANEAILAPDLDADLILMAVGGLAQGIASDQYPAGSALRLVDHMLDRILGAGPRFERPGPKPS